MTETLKGIEKKQLVGRKSLNKSLKVKQCPIDRRGKTCSHSRCCWWVKWVLRAMYWVKWVLRAIYWVKWVLRAIYWVKQHRGQFPDVLGPRPGWSGLLQKDGEEKFKIRITGNSLKGFCSVRGAVWFLLFWFFFFLMGKKACLWYYTFYYGLSPAFCRFYLFLI